MENEEIIIKEIIEALQEKYVITIMKNFKKNETIVQNPDKNNISGHAKIFNIDNKNYYYFYIGHYNIKSKIYSQYGSNERNENDAVTYIRSFDVVHKNFKSL